MKTCENNIDTRMLSLYRLSFESRENKDSGIISMSDIFKHSDWLSNHSSFIGQPGEVILPLQVLYGEAQPRGLDLTLS